MSAFDAPKAIPWMEIRRLVDAFYTQVYEQYKARNSQFINAHSHTVVIQCLPYDSLKIERDQAGVLQLDRVRLLRAPAAYGVIPNSVIQEDGDKLDCYVLVPPLLQNVLIRNLAVKIVPLAIIHTTDGGVADPKIIGVLRDYLPYYFTQWVKQGGVQYLGEHSAPGHLLTTIASLLEYSSKYKANAFDRYVLLSKWTDIQSYDQAQAYLLANRLSK